MCATRTIEFDIRGRCTACFGWDGSSENDHKHAGDAVIEMWRPNTDAWALRGHLDSVAATIIDGETASRLRQERLAGSRSREERRRAAMAKSPVAGKYDVTIDPNSA
jgi:hypothetical protein